MCQEENHATVAGSHSPNPPIDPYSLIRTVAGFLQIHSMATSPPIRVLGDEHVTNHMTESSEQSRQLQT